MRQSPLWLPVDLADLISMFCMGVWGWPFFINVLIGECDKARVGNLLTTQASFPSFARASGDGHFLLTF
jgi:hypothetical protein